jgi:competence CoiA-like predicted nuclease
MIYAAQGLAASPGIRSRCPLCHEVVIPKCGEIKIWHWAHKSIADCDPWYEPETEWHKAMKELFPPNCREVVIPPHRADARTARGWVVEFQHSAISPQKIREREDFYGDMLWVLDARSWNVALHHIEDSLVWENRRAHPSWAEAECPIILDIGYTLVHIYSAPSATVGYGEYIERKNLFRRLCSWEGVYVTL